MKQPFERIVEAHGLSVLRVCRALLDEHRAQDAWSETFLSALKAYPELAPDANVQAWLVRIAHRKAIDQLRRNSRETTDPEAGSNERAVQAGPEAQLENRELWQLVRELPNKQRQVVAYRYLGGLDYRQISLILSCAPEAARRAAADGIRNLRQLIGPDAFPGDES